jgi:branched-chain amino acid transport system substrate-binding protein
LSRSAQGRRHLLLGGAAGLGLGAMAGLGALAGLGSISGCSDEPALHLGFIGTLPQRASDLGVAGRNGAMLAIEQRNQAGGVRGRPVQLTVEDDGQDPAQAGAAFARLRAAGVQAVIGPFTSGMAAVLVPLADAAGLVMVSPTVTSLDFYGKDDHFFRLHRTTRDNAGDYARMLTQRGQHRIAVAYDLGNRSFSVSWLAEFRHALGALGGEVLLAEPFQSMAESGAQPLVQRLLDSRPDALLFIAAAFDVARLGRLARARAPGMPMAAAEWAATESLLELGGVSLDGLLILHPYDREDASPHYQAFDEAFRRRFQRAPGYSAVAGFDAATVLCQATERRRPGRSLKQALLETGPFDGLQQRIVFDRYGDTDRRVVFTEIRGGRFVVLR